MHINLLPPRFALRVAVLRRARSWAPVWIVLLVVSLATVAYAFRMYRQSAAVLAALVERGHALRSIQAETATYERQRIQLQDEIHTIQSLQSRDRTLALLGLLGRSAQAAERLQLQRMAFTAPTRLPPGPRATVPNPDPTRAPELAMLTLQGIAGGDAALARFIDSLRSLGIFERVDLKSLSQLRSPPDDGRQFQVECRFAE
jgi:Tfp pilus assembly protein PilN